MLAEVGTSRLEGVNNALGYVSCRKSSLHHGGKNSSSPQEAPNKVEYWLLGSCPR